jgi:uncharacterized protein YbjQ (UPF0145 family)
MSQRMLFSTTSSLEGFEIIQYLGPVTAHVVIGTGIFTDFFSAWTDFFGAKSRAYQSKLDEIEAHTMALLEAKAQSVQANAVIGLRVDFDEIAGAGKSMLMVTAMGTAIQAQRATRFAEASNAITGTTLQEAITRQQYLDAARAGKLNWNEECWAYAIQNRVEELAGPALAHAITRASDVLHYDKLGPQAWLERLEDLFNRLPSRVTEPLLYDALVRSVAAHRLASYMIDQVHLFNSERVLQGLGSEDRQYRVWSLQAVKANKRHWTAADIDSLKQIMGSLSQSFANPIPLTEEKALLRIKQVWRCLCGQQVAADFSTCDTCTRDRHGFAQNELRPENAKDILLARINALERLVAGRGVDLNDPVAVATN